MLSRFCCVCMVLLSASVWSQEINPAVSVDDRTVGGDPMKRYFSSGTVWNPGMCPRSIACY